MKHLKWFESMCDVLWELALVSRARRCYMHGDMLFPMNE